MNKLLLLSSIAFIILLSFVTAVEWRDAEIPLKDVGLHNGTENGQAESEQGEMRGLTLQKTQSEPEPQSQELDVFESFDYWQQSQNSLDTTWIDQGIVLAKQRAVEMQRLMSENPSAALDKALSFSEYAALPQSIAQLVEEPFSSTADLLVLPVEPARDGSAPAHDSHELVSLSLEDGDFELNRFGRRAQVDSKNSLAAQGFTLAGAALLDDKPLRIVSGAEAEYVVANFPNRDATVDAYTGVAIEQKPIVAIAGGEVFYFAKQSNVIALNNDLLELEQRPGPNNGSPMLFRSLADAGYSEELLAKQNIDAGASLSEQLLGAKASVNPWTTTDKNVFFIRVDFSDKPGEPITQAALTDILNSTSNQIRDMSRGRTGLRGLDGPEADVSASVVRVAGVSTSYNPNTLYSAAFTAFNALGTDINLGDYDIVGLFFTDIDTPDTDFGFAGLAGGSRQWIQDSTNVLLFVHEFGHNYGLPHASYWQTSDGSSVGAGGSEEYGNIFDIMGDGLFANGYFHPQALERLDWLDMDEWTSVASSGLHRVHRFDDPLADNVQTLRIPKGTNEYYWLGHRQRINNGYLRSGLQLLWQRPSNSRAWLVDSTPGSAPGKQDTSITLGRTYVDGQSNVFITPLAKGGSAPNEWVDVQINLGDFSGNQAPSVAISGVGTANAREPQVFSAVASDPDGDDLAYQWDFGDGVIHPSDSSVVQSWVAGGTYSVTVTVSDMKGQTASDSIQVTVSDPINSWNQRTSTTASALNDIATDGNMLVAVGDNGVIVRSTDNGANWLGGASLRSASGGSIGFIGNLDLLGVNYSGSLWTTVGRDFDSGGFIGQIFTSSDGITWFRRVDGGAPLSDITSNASIRVATGTDGRITRSSDGVNWQESTSNTIKILDGVAFGNDKFVAVGGWQRSGTFGRTTAPLIALSSSDGVSWTDVSASTGFTFQGLEQIEFLNNLFVANGFFSSLRYSSNGESFETAYADREDRFSAFAHGNGVYFAGGQGSQGDINLVSPDGQQWTNAETFDQPNRNSAIFFANTFITVGDGGTIYQSDVVPEPIVIGPNADGDQYSDADDNCPAVPNNDQLDTDGDGEGDACDIDDDGDSTLDLNDCAPLDENNYMLYMAYLDADGDTVGTGGLQSLCAADSVPVGYTVTATNDNCPAISNPDQLNTDQDSQGNVCDADDDNDNVLDGDDAFPLDETESVDADNDGTGDNADLDDDNDLRADLLDCAPLDATRYESYSAYIDADGDGFGIGEVVQLCAAATVPAGYSLSTNDNCPAISNPDQLNTDEDSQGNVCDADDDNDQVLDGDDAFPLDVNESADADNDGTGDNADLDDDNDQRADLQDCAPLDATRYQSYSAYVDTDGDDIGFGGLVSLCAAATLPAGYTEAATGDNCPAVSNAQQINTDEDAQGDLCDLNDDNDAQPDATDCAVLDNTAWQNFSAYIDTDEDGVGVGDLTDICAGLSLPAGYATAATDDNCPAISNSDQSDIDNDNDGDVCDADADSDGVLSGEDDDDLNPMLCRDLDNDSCNDCSVGVDGLGPLADFLQDNDGLDTDQDGLCDIGDLDDDGDGEPDLSDACSLIPNSQVDANDNGIDDACEVEVDEDDILDFIPVIISATRKKK